MRHAARVDANQEQIVSALRAAGAFVWIIGLPVDLLVGYKNHTFLVEVKSTSKNNRAYHYPFCKHHKPKLEVNMDTNAKGDNPWHCWVCNTKGRKLTRLFKHVEVPLDSIC